MTPTNYVEILKEFRVNFDHLYYHFRMNMSLKMHIIVDHYQEYFDLAGKTFRHTNGEFVESSHHSIKQEDITHNFKIKRVIGTPIHREKSLKSIIWHNSRRAGFTKSTEFRLRNKNVK